MAVKTEGKNKTNEEDTRNLTANYSDLHEAAEEIDELYNKLDQYDWVEKDSYTLKRSDGTIPDIHIEDNKSGRFSSSSYRDCKIEISGHATEGSYQLDVDVSFDRETDELVQTNLTEIIYNHLT